nr:unnamed protein product [Neurospora crassa]
MGNKKKSVGGKINFLELLTFIQFLTHKLTLTPPKPHLFVTSNLQASIWNWPSKSRITEISKAIWMNMIKKFKIFIFFALPTMLIVKGIYICYDQEIWTLVFFTQNLVKNFPFFGLRLFNMIWVESNLGVEASNLGVEASNLGVEAPKASSIFLDLHLWTLMYLFGSLARIFGELYYSDFELPAGVGGESCEKKTPSPRGPLTLYKKGSDSGASGGSDSPPSAKGNSGASSGPNQDRLAPETDSEDETTQTDQGPRSRGYRKTRTRSMVRRRWIRDKPDWVEGLWTRSSTEGVENLDATKASQTKSAAENLDAIKASQTPKSAAENLDAAAIKASQTPKSAAENLDAAKGSKSKSKSAVKKAAKAAKKLAAENLDAIKASQTPKSAAENLDAAAIKASQTPKSAAENLDAAKGSQTKSAPKNLAPITGSQAPKVKAALAEFLGIETSQLQTTAVVRELATKLEDDLPGSLDFADQENGNKIISMLKLREFLQENNRYRSTIYKSLGQFMDPESHKNLKEILDKLEESKNLLMTEGQKHKNTFDRNSQQNTAYNFKGDMKKYLELQNKVQHSQMKNFKLAESIIQKNIQREYKCKELKDFLHQEFPTSCRDFNDQEMKLKKYFLNAFNQAKTKN